MKISLMQGIDYWVGIPLCFIFTLWHKARSWLFPLSTARPKKILFIELSEMGSAVLGYSSLVRAKSEFQGAELFFLIFKRNRESVDLLEIMPRENVITVRDENLFLFSLSLFKALYKIYRLQIDTTIDMELFSRCTVLISYLSGALNRVGFHNYTAEGLYRGSLLTHPVLYNPHQHMSLNFLSLLFSLKEPAPELPLLKKDLRRELCSLPLRLPSSDESLAMRERLRAENPKLAGTGEIVLMNPDPGLLPLRGWPLSHFSALAAKIIQSRRQALIVTIGLERSRRYSQAICQNLPSDNCIDFTGKTESLGELLVLFSIAKVLVTNDSGPAHLASLVGLRTLVLFGPETPALYCPLGDKVTVFYAGLACSPCLAAYNHRRTFCANNRCLQEIQVADVLKAALGALK